MVKANLKGLIVLSALLFESCYVSKHPVKTTPKNYNANKKTKIVFNLKPLPLQTPTLRELGATENEENHVESILVNLSFDNVDIKKALIAIGKAVGYNVIIPPDIEGRVSIEIRNQFLQDCLNCILKPFGYSFKISDKNIYVITKETKIFHIDLPNTSRQFSSLIEASIGGSSSENTGTSSSGSATMSINNFYNLNIWNNIKNSLDTIIKPDKSASYSIEPISGTIVVSAKPATLEKVKEFIDTINRDFNRQVLIEAKIVEVKLDKKNEYGINWKYLTFSNLLGSGGEYDTIIFNSGVPEEKPFQVSVVKVNKTFSSILGILSRFGKVNVLSSPRIMAMNGQPAMIKVGRDYISIYRMQTTTTTATGSQTASTLSTEEITTSTILTEGVVLTILPKVDNKGNIILNISPAISSLNTPLTTGDSGSESEFINKVYSVNVRQLNTVVKVKDGQTIILGGLIAKSKTKNREGVPILEDLPIIGNAFKSESTLSSKTELIIMLTPHLRSIE